MGLVAYQQVEYRKARCDGRLGMPVFECQHIMTGRQTGRFSFCLRASAGASHIVYQAFAYLL
jgi:hypothetical protein